MSVFLATSLAPQIDLRLLRRDYFDGISLLLQDADGVPYDLANVQVCASIFKNTISGTTEQVTSLNIEEQEPLRNGTVRLWLSSAQTALAWDAAAGVGPANISQAFFLLPTPLKTLVISCLIPYWAGTCALKGKNILQTS